MRGDGGCSATGIAFTVHEAVPLKVLALQVDIAGSAAETFDVEFLDVRRAGAGTFVGRQILAFNAVVAPCADRAVAFMVVLRAVWAVLEDIEVVRFEGEAASETGEAAAVVAAC